jgi:multicomponent Na+:H+ antiporter subunit G
MGILEWIRFLAGVGLLLVGMGIFVLQLFGVFKFKYVLNRMHAAAMGDTLGIGVSLT